MRIEYPSGKKLANIFHALLHFTTTAILDYDTRIALL